MLWIIVLDCVLHASVAPKGFALDSSPRDGLFACSGSNRGDDHLGVAKYYQYSPVPRASRAAAADVRLGRARKLTRCPSPRSRARPPRAPHLSLRRSERSVPVLSAPPGSSAP